LSRANRRSARAQEPDHALLQQLGALHVPGPVGPRDGGDQRHVRLDEPRARRRIAGLGRDDELALAGDGGRGTVAQRREVGPPRRGALRLGPPEVAGQRAVELAPAGHLVAERVGAVVVLGGRVHEAGR
jgi:hypothetical protein